MEIKRLKESDMKKVMVIEKNCFEDICEDKEVILDRIRTFGEGCFGVWEENHLRGYCSSEIWNDFHKIKLNVNASLFHNSSGKILYISAMAVLPNYQGKGFGSYMIDKLIQLAKKKNLFSLYLRTSNARRFYEKNGFVFLKHVSKEKDSYDIMKLDL